MEFHNAGKHSCYKFQHINWIKFSLFFANTLRKSLDGTVGVEAEASWVIAGVIIIGNLSSKNDW